MKNKKILKYFKQCERPIVHDGELYIHRIWHTIGNIISSEVALHGYTTSEIILDTLVDRTLTSIFKESNLHQADIVFAGFDSKTPLSIKSVWDSVSKKSEESYKANRKVDVEGLRSSGMSDEEIQDKVLKDSFKAKHVKLAQKRLMALLPYLGVIPLGFYATEADDFASLLAKPGLDLFSKGSVGLLSSNDKDWYLAIKDTRWFWRSPTTSREIDYEDLLSMSTDRSQKPSIVSANILAQKCFDGDPSDNVDKIKNFSGVKAQPLSVILYNEKGEFDDKILKPDSQSYIISKIEDRCRYWDESFIESRYSSKFRKELLLSKWVQLLTPKILSQLKKNWELMSLDWIFSDKYLIDDYKIYEYMMYHLMKQSKATFKACKDFPFQPSASSLGLGYSYLDSKRKWSQLVKESKYVRILDE